MVLDISIEAIEIPFDNTSRYYAYTVHASDHRILTFVTSSGQTLSKWLNDLLKSTNKNNRSILVGVSVEHESMECIKCGVRDQPYDILTLCVGSQCLIYHLDTRKTTYDERDLTPNKSLRAFFENPRVVALGMEMEMEAVSRKLEWDHEIKIKNAVELRGMATERLKKKGEQLDLMRYDLDKLATTVLGNYVDVVRPEGKVEWYYDDSIDFWWWECEMTMEKVQFATIDVYLCFLVGSELHDMIHHSAGVEDSFKSKKKNMKKEKNNKKN